jgi:hypothetical protein
LLENLYSSDDSLRDVHKGSFEINPSTSELAETKASGNESSWYFRGINGMSRIERHSQDWLATYSF